MSNPISKAHIHESNLIEGFDDPQIDKQSLHAWSWLIKFVSSKSGRRAISHENICELQKKLTAHQAELDDMWRGTYRDRSRTRVWVGGKEGLSPEQVQTAMDDWLQNIYPVASPKESHIAFERIHPFIDGNGRTGRMLMWYREKQLGLPMTLITKRDVADYYDWFK